MARLARLRRWEVRGCPSCDARDVVLGVLWQHLCAVLAYLHCDACVGTWCEWGIALVRHTNVGQWACAAPLRGKRTGLVPILMARTLRLGLVGTVLELGTGRLQDGHEMVILETFEWVSVRSTLRCGVRL